MQIEPAASADNSAPNQRRPAVAAEYFTMTEAMVAKLCKENGGYKTPELNRQLHLHYKGFRRIANLEAFTAVVVLWLEHNSLEAITGIGHMTQLNTLYVQHNLIDSLVNAPRLLSLRHINLSHNRLRSLVGIEAFPNLEKLLAADNLLISVGNLENCCPNLTVLDLGNNELASVDSTLAVVAGLVHLCSLNLAGNPLVRSINGYRRKMILENPSLHFLDDAPIKDDERRCVEAWSVGGSIAEREERQKIKEEERKWQKQQLADWDAMRRDAVEAGQRGQLAAAGTLRGSAVMAPRDVDGGDRNDASPDAAHGSRGQDANVDSAHSSVERQGRDGGDDPSGTGDVADPQHSQHNRVPDTAYYRMMQQLAEEELEHEQEEIYVPKSRVHYHGRAYPTLKNLQAAGSGNNSPEKKHRGAHMDPMAQVSMNDSRAENDDDIASQQQNSETTPEVAPPATVTSTTETDMPSSRAQHSTPPQEGSSVVLPPLSTVEAAITDTKYPQLSVDRLKGIFEAYSYHAVSRTGRHSPRRMDYSGVIPQSISFNGLRRLLEDSELFVGSELDLLLEQLKPPQGKEVTWDDFLVIIEILSVLFFPDDSEGASMTREDRIIGVVVTLIDRLDFMAEAIGGTESDSSVSTRATDRTGTRQTPMKKPRPTDADDDDV